MFLQKISEILDSILGADTLDLPGFRRRVLRVTQILAATLIKFRKDNCNQLAAALSFKLVFSLVPLIVVSFSIFAFHPDLAGVKSKVQGFLFKHFIPTSSELISGHITDFLETASAVSIVGFAVFVLIAISLFSTIETSFNQIWQNARKRPFLHRSTSFTSGIFLMTILIGTSIYFTARVEKILLVDSLMRIETLNRGILFGLPILFTWVSFSFLYILIPTARVRVLPAFIAGAFAGVLWEISKHGFNLYIAKAVTYNKIYGSLGAIPVFLAWVYLSWIILLLGAELSFILQTDRRSGNTPPGAHKQASDGYLAIRVVDVIVEAFSKGNEPLTLPEIARTLKMHDHQVEGFLDSLIAGGIVTSAGDALDRYLPSRAPDMLKLSDVFALIEPEPGGDRNTDAIEKISMEAERARLRVLLDRSFGDLHAEGPDRDVPDPT